jgi:hypothetical protein
MNKVSIATAKFIFRFATANQNSQIKYLEAKQ